MKGLDDETLLLFFGLALVGMFALLLIIDAGFSP